MRLVQKNYSNSELLELMQSTRREEAFTFIYQKTFPMVLHYIQKNKGSATEAKDIFQDALLIFFEKSAAESFQLQASVSTYLMGICKNLWLRQLHKNTQRQSFETEELQSFDLIDEKEFELEHIKPERKIMEFLADLGEKCKEILESFYYFRQNMEQIAQKYQYRNVRTATVQKYKCLERLRKNISAEVKEPEKLLL